jgi:hypothetical protein
MNQKSTEKDYDSQNCKEKQKQTERRKQTTKL